MNAIQKRTACNRDCPDACGIIATIEDGQVTRIQGDKEHPVTQGFLCHRTSRFLERQYSPERLTQPLLRSGNEFKPIPWSDALDLIADKLRTFRDESGPESILNYRCGGSMGMMKLVGDHFFQKFGPVTTKSGDICSGAGEAAQNIDFGVCDSNDLFDLENSQTIFIWGKNVFVSSVHLIPILKAARKRGTRIVLIDPVHHQTASIADHFVQPKPGTDAAIAFGIARWLFENELHDQQAGSYCDHIDEFRSLVFSRTIDEWSAIAEIATDELITLAESFSQGPTATIVGWGMQRRKHGGTAVRSIDALTAISGNLGVAGGGVSYYFARRSGFDLSFLDAIAAPRQIPEPILGPGILNATDPPIRMIFNWAANPVAMLPESKTVVDAFESREFTVVVDSFMTDTARCADLVLPATTMLEEEDLLGAYGHHLMIGMQPVVDPPAGVLTDYQIFQQLAARLDLTGELSEFQHDVAWWKQRLLKKVTDQVDIKTINDARAIRNPLAANILFADRRFATASGKVNLIDQLRSDVFPQRDNASTRLKLAALSTEKAQSSQWPPELQTGPAIAVVHPSGASGFADGQHVRLRTAVGEMSVRLQFDDQQRTDIVLLEKGGWLSADRCANSLIQAEATDIGDCAVYYDTPVEIVDADSQAE